MANIPSTSLTPSKAALEQIRMLSRSKAVLTGGIDSQDCFLSALA
jgi:hypothetical protein